MEEIIEHYAWWYSVSWTYQVASGASLGIGLVVGAFFPERVRRFTAPVERAGRWLGVRLRLLFRRRRARKPVPVAALPPARQELE